MARNDGRHFSPQNKKAYAQVKIDKALFAKELFKNISPFPLVSDLYEEWKGILNGMQEVRNRSRIIWGVC